MCHTIAVTGANIHDVTMTLKLLTGEEETVHGGVVYLGANKREDVVKYNNYHEKINYKINVDLPSVRKGTIDSKNR